MKISKSKKQLARIISENGGWRDGDKFAAQDSDGDIFFYKTEPTRVGRVWRHNGVLGGDWIECDNLLSNWHQTVLSRDEYFHLYPAPDADGWIEWKGGECPVDPGTMVICRLIEGYEWMGGNQVKAESMCWGHNGYLDIIAYRLHKPEHVEQEYPDGVKPTDPAKQNPTIEQLAADYRNTKDYAERKQQEADAAKAEAEAKLAELVAAGKAVGLVVSVAAPEPELVITDWRDLRVGDELIALRVVNVDGVDGKRCFVVKTQDNANGAFVLARFDDGNTWWVREWRFNRRPTNEADNA